MRRLLDPTLTAEQHRREAVGLGRRHILSGVSGPWLVQSIWLYQELLADALRHAAVSPPALMHLHTIVTQRLAHEMTGQLDGMDQVQRLLAEAADGLDAEIDRRAEERSWAHCVMHLDNPWILDRVTRAGMDAGKVNAAIDERAAVLLRQHLADAREAAKKKKQAEALDAIRAQGRAERARYRY